MIKKLLLITLLICSGTAALAVSFTIDPANILSSWYQSRHWPMVSAVALFTGMVAASWKMGKIENETQARMISDLFKTVRYIAVFLLCVEFYKPLKGIWVNILGIAYDLFKSVMGYML